MELNTIKQDSTWGEASSAINTNFNKIDISIEGLRDATVRNKGYYKTSDELIALNPTAPAGAKAYVGSYFPYDIYLWDSSTMTWVYSGDKGGDESLDLDNYYTKDEQLMREKLIVTQIQKNLSDAIDDVKDDYDNVMSEEAYEALAVKEDKFYFTYEDE